MPGSLSPGFALMMVCEWKEGEEEEGEDGWGSQGGESLPFHLSGVMKGRADQEGGNSPH